MSDPDFYQFSVCTVNFHQFPGTIPAAKLPDSLGKKQGLIFGQRHVLLLQKSISHTNSHPIENHSGGEPQGEIGFFAAYPNFHRLLHKDTDDVSIGGIHFNQVSDNAVADQFQNLF